MANLDPQREPRDRAGAASLGAAPVDTASLAAPPRLHVLLVSSPLDRFTGVDRAGITLCNALDPGRFRITWAGAHGCEALRPLLDERVVERIVGYPIRVFEALIQENQFMPRSPWLWTKIIGREVQGQLAAAGELAAGLGPDRPELVVTNSASLPSGAIFARRQGIPHLWIINEWFDPQRSGCRGYAKIMAALSRKILVTSESCGAVFTAAGAQQNVVLVPEGNEVQFVLANRDQRCKADVLREFAWPGGRPLVAQVGALRPWKGQQVSLEALKILAGRHPAPICSFLFLGSGSEADRARLDALAGGLPAAWQGAVAFKKFAADDYSYMAATDFTVHPSTVPDPYPNAVREAMILGKAVIGSNEGGIPDIIRHLETGLLIPARDAEALAAAMERLLQDDDERLRLSEAAGAWARTFFDPKLRVKGFVAAMESCLGKS